MRRRLISRQGELLRSWWGESIIEITILLLHLSSSDDDIISILVRGGGGRSSTAYHLQPYCLRTKHTVQVCNSICRTKQ
jgi:hypothetical protein